MISRRPKLRWWSSLGGETKEVVRCGSWPEGLYGSDAIGIPPALLRDARKMHAGIARVKCRGASVTARLALGGRDFQEADPAVIFCNPPFRKVLDKIWDYPKARGELVKMWLRAREAISEAASSQWWRRVRGPVGAAMLHIRRLGGQWHKPFKIWVLDREVDVLQIPPAQVLGLLREQARISLDCRLVGQLCDARGWCKDEVMHKYRWGIDWECIRRVLKESGTINAAEKSALFLVACGGYWAEDRKWRAGLRGTGTCDNCCQAIGTDWHSLHGCEALHWPLLKRMLEGQIQKAPPATEDAALHPLTCAALPPKSTRWVPTEPEIVEGALWMGVGEHSFGDGSGVRQQHRDCRIATWCVARVVDDGHGGYTAGESLRGNVTGWYPTVPRGEIKAFIEHARHAAPGSCYWGDCKHVIDVIKDGIPEKWASSACANADLWAEARRLLLDHGGAMRAEKVEAHRSFSAAEAEGDLGIMTWHGNDQADCKARGLANYLAAGDARESIREQEAELHKHILRRMAVAAAWTLARRPKAERRRIGLRDQKPGYEGEDGDNGHCIRRRPGGGWECATCLRYSNKKNGEREIAKRKCTGDVRRLVHPSHSMGSLEGTLWCQKCGYFATRWPRHLRLPCVGKPVSGAQCNIRRRLAENKQPTTAAYLSIEAGIREGYGAVANVRTDGAASCRTSSATSSHRYLRLPGGPLHSLACSASRDMQEDVKGGSRDGPVTECIVPLAKAAMCAKDLRMAESESPGSADGSRTSQHHQRSEDEALARLVRRRLTRKTRVEVPHEVVLERGGDGLEAERPCNKLAMAASWIGRVAIGGAKHSSPRLTCGSPARTRCRGCLNAMCIRCMRSYTKCAATTCD